MRSHWQELRKLRDSSERTSPSSENGGKGVELREHEQLSQGEQRQVHPEAGLSSKLKDPMIEIFVDAGLSVFLQGQFMPSFFGVKNGRFALVRSSNSGVDLSQLEFLSQAKLMGVATAEGIFGEFGALLQEPQPYSAFALEPGIIQVLSGNAPDLASKLGQNPKYGVKTCVSFAEHLKTTLDHFALLVEGVGLLDQTGQAASGSYLSLINDLELQGGADSIKNLVRMAKEHKAFKRAQYNGPRNLDNFHGGD